MKEKFKLIEGVFIVSDAKEILLTLIEEKIKFHELKSFSDEVKLGKKSEDSLIKVADLRATKTKIIAFIDDDKTKSKISINSFIEIESLES
jgi:hypothetical protein